MQTIFADNSYSKPFFVTYVNSSLFIIPLFTIILGRLFKLWRQDRLSQIDSFQSLLEHLDSHDSKLETPIIESRNSEDRLDDAGLWTRGTTESADTSKLGLRATAKLSFEFCILWVRPQLHE